ncbi:MAG: hypothetical protein EOP84_20005 [Verrucomicrobiaceae bacterium]|nr:MAG: hypothetical protein EOP84_20005 [Verrucomicrobiaceae bacterium]
MIDRYRNQELTLGGNFMGDISPIFPALIVYEDATVGSLTSLGEWTGDVDQWFWSDPGAFLIDSHGRRFDQQCERDSGGRPIDIPRWKYTSQVDEDVIASLVARTLGMKNEAKARLGSATKGRGRIRCLIDQVVEFDAR